MINRRLLASLVLAGLVAAPARATSLLDGVAGKLDGTSSSDAGTIAAYDAAAAKADAVWVRMPLAVRHALFVKQKGAGYGIYEARPTNEFAPGETLFIYAEPIGFIWTPESAGGFRFGVIADLAVKDDEGNTLYDKAAFATLPLVSREKNREFMLNFDVTLTGLKPGLYKVGVTLHDLNSAKTTSFALPFKIAG